MVDHHCFLSLTEVGEEPCQSRLIEGQNDLRAHPLDIAERVACPAARDLPRCRDNACLNLLLRLNPVTAQPLAQPPLEIGLRQSGRLSSPHSLEKDGLQRLA